MDYRFYTTRRVAPAFSFGFGLSYTTFNYSNLSCSPRGVSLQVLNSGRVAGAEVVQLYLGFPAAAASPAMQLKGFVKTAPLLPGASTPVTLPLQARDLAVWDAGERQWRAVAGTFLVYVGAAVDEIRLLGSFDVSP